MRKRRIYISGPISKGDMLANLRAADAAFFALLKAGFAPLNQAWSVFAGSVSGSYVGEIFATADATPSGTTREDWTGVGLPWVETADAVLRLPGESVGADLETAHAKLHGVPVFDSVEALVAGLK